MAGSFDRRGGRGGERPSHPYPRTARVNAQLVEVLAVALERVSDDDERLGLLTVTAVSTEPDLRHATVFFDSLTPAAAEALAEHRASLQAAIARQVRMKRTPQLRFAPDPAVAAGERVEEALRRVHRRRD
jgi:ribosome-binding factor A